MGKRGPRPLPTAVLELRGSWKAKTRTGEPQPEGEAIPPDWLDDIAKEEWNRLAPELKRLGLLRSLDQTAFALYCDLFSCWRRASAELEKTGRYYQSGDLQKLHPLSNVVDQLATRLMAMMKEFGCTPSARTGLNVQPPIDPVAYRKRERFFPDTLEAYNLNPKPADETAQPKGASFMAMQD